MGRLVLAAGVALPLTLSASTLLLAPPAIPSPLLLALVLVTLAGAATLLAPLAPRIPGPGFMGLLVPTVMISWGSGRLLSAPYAARLAWLLGEEDNAHVIGVARERLSGSGSGMELSTQYGTSFTDPGVLLLRSGLLGDPTGDPRLDAVTAVTASATLLPFAVLFAMLVAAAALGASPVGPGSRALVAVASLLAGTAAQLLVVALPLQLGFITLAWAVAWTMTGWAAAIGLTVQGLPRRTRVALLAQVGAAAVLLEGSWPFLAGALLLPAAVSIAPDLRHWARRAGSGASTRAVVILASLALGAGALLAGSGAIRAVLGLGRVALTAGVEVGSSIVTIGPTLLVAGALAILGVCLGVRPNRRAAFVAMAAAAGGLASLAILALIALAVSDGVTGYGGSKVLLASVLLAVAGFAASVSAGRLPRIGVVASGLILALVIADPLGRTALDWWDRTSPAEPPHAVATISALTASSADVPIRCRPNRGTEATPRARIAAYFCIVWMEDAFNPDRSSGNRFEFFEADEATFDEALEEAEADGLYGFAYLMQLGPGWFGWDGTS